MSSLELTLLGGFRARFSSGDEFVPRSKKAALLLARLALRAGEVHTRETLIGLLWSDRGEAQARASLRQELTVLRKMMGTSSPVLAIDGERLSLDATAIEVDVRAFEALAKSEATRDLERAASLYRGPLLEGFAIRDAACEEWIMLERQRLRDLFLSVLDRLLARQMQEGAIHRAITTAQTLLAHDPLREDAHRTLMLLHAQQGRRSLALKQYQAFSELLRSELGVDPEPETVRLHAEIQAGRAAPSQPAARLVQGSNGATASSAAAQTTGSDRPAPPSSASGEAADAYQFYLMGRSFFLRNVWGKGALEAARRLFEQAIEIDPSYARAYAGLADCDCYRLLLGVPNASLDTIAANVARALELGPDLAEGHAANGLMLYATGQHDAANAAFEHAVRLGPELFEVHYFYARNCRAQGLHEKAAELFERSAAINQNDFRALGLLVDEYRALGRLDDSLSAARRCLERVNVEVAAQPDDSYALAFGSNILAELGQRELAEQWAARAGGIDPDDAIVNYNLACTYAALDRPDAALDRLRATFGAPSINRRVFLEWMRHDTAIDPLREHPDFVALVERLEADGVVSAPERMHAVSVTCSAGGRPSIAVLPFANISGDPEQDYFADGLTEDIITDLSRVSGLFVVARNTVFTLKGKPLQARLVARELNVGHVLVGSVREAEGRVRVTAQLVDGRTGGHLWANRYDRSLAGIFALQDEISRSIVEALKVQLLPNELATITNRPTTNAEAYQYCLMGRSLLLRGGRGRRALRHSREMFSEAIAIDPRYARAYAGLANCDSYLLCLGDTTVSMEGIIATSERALSLEPDLAEAHAARGLALYMAGCHDEADIVLDKAMQLGPDLFEAHYFAGRNHQARGHYDTAATLFEHAAQIEPSDFLALGLAVATYRSLGREADMLSAGRRCLERVEAEIATHPDNADALAFAASVQAETGDKARAEEWAGRAARLDPGNAITNYNLACAYAALGKLDVATSHLQRVFAGLPANWRSHLEWMRHDSSMDPLRAHPGYCALLNRVESEARAGPSVHANAGAPPEDLPGEPEQQSFADGEARGRLAEAVRRADVTEQSGAARAPDKHAAVAVLPFADLSGDPDQQYFSDGITEDIITELSRWRQLKVMSRNSSFRYRGSAIDVKQVRRDLGVDYVVEGSVRRVGDRIRVTAQLVDAETGSHVWAERYDRDLQELFAVQGEVVQTIVGTLVGRVQAAGAERAKRKPPSSLAAYDCVLRGLALPWGDPAADAEARRLYERAIELDPEYGLAHALLALMTYEEWGIDPALSDAALDRAFELAKRAVELDANESTCQFMLGFIHLMRRSFDLAEQYHRRAVEMNPSNPQHLADMGSLLVYLGRPDEGLEWLDQARRVDPYFGPPWYWHQVGFAQMTARRYDEAIQAFERSTTVPYWVRAYIAACHAQAGRMAQAKEWAAQALRLRPDFSATWNATKEPFRHRSDADHLIEGLRKAGIPEFAAAQPATGNDRRTVAVLPFENLGGNPSEEYFSDGITDDIITELSRFHQLIVVARHSSFQYRDRSADVNRIGRELQVAYLVEGSIRRIGDRIRITAQLIETATGRHLWAERYDRSLDDLFDLQDEVARMIASALAVRIEAADLAKTKRKPPDSMDAYDYWLRGKKCLDLWTPEANAEARRLFAKAVECDPDYARGHAGLAFTHEWAAYYTAWDPEGSSSHEGARRHAERAVALDDTDHLPHVILGWVHHQRGAFEQAEQQFDRAIAINPNDADAIMHRAMVLALERRTDEAIENAELAMRLNPRHPDWYLAFLGACLFRAHRYADAAATWERAPDSIPEIRACLAAACVLTGRPHDARRHMEEFLHRFSLHWTGQPGARAFVATEFSFEAASDLERFAAALREAGMPE